MHTIEIWRAAKDLVDRYREDAPIRAAFRADALLARGDLDGCRVWLDILDAVRELLAFCHAETVH